MIPRIWYRQLNSIVALPAATHSRPARPSSFSLHPSSKPQRTWGSKWAEPARPPQLLDQCALYRGDAVMQRVHHRAGDRHGTGSLGRVSAPPAIPRPGMPRRPPSSQFPAIVLCVSQPRPFISSTSPLEAMEIALLLAVHSGSQWGSESHPHAIGPRDSKSCGQLVCQHPVASFCVSQLRRKQPSRSLN